MKNFIVFIISFVVLFTVTQILSGMLLTTLYTPDLSESWMISEHLPKSISFGNSTFMPSLILAMFSVIVAYFMPRLFKRISKN
ncbi:hypothetical protein ACIQ4I_04305 [Rummeliibacillus sp. NPDC094406]|uniref:hypothetical protein n=1 Tax=Rummeliibacillus sp. NPDC094406 TaxID=3364511 RepID=UPI00381A0613